MGTGCLVLEIKVIVRTVTSSFIKKGYNFTTRDRNHDRGRKCTNSFPGGWWYSINCHNGLLTGEYPSPDKISLPIRAPGVLIYEVVGYYSNLHCLLLFVDGI